ncbi:hypothetical protein HU200_016725 [Digitaria exilis]|uniref:Uncharacterized protein n=1 Tax=Digitaria exilis TaxID=1010633 RepID=A0A835F890_9POAL|nr:hypothetical protein HU200_016725 [Digitaria exilis]
MLHRDKAVLLLIASAIIFAHPAIGGKRKRCTDEDKKNVLTHCHDYASRHGTTISPHRNSHCCMAVREVPGNEVRSIVNLLTDAEKGQHDVPRILTFGSVCGDGPKYPPDQVRNYLCQ